MDVNTLLYRTRATGPNDYARKAFALQSAYAIARDVAPELTSVQFMQRVTNIAGRVFGGAAQDSYLTAALSVIASVDFDIDGFLAGVLNATVLQLNFQTRIFLDGNQSVIYDGPESYFVPAMLHGNVTLGIRLTATPTVVELPIWANRSSALEVNAERLHRLPSTEVENYQAANLCKVTGALLVVEPTHEADGFILADRYEFLAQTVTVDTLYCVAGAAEMVCAAAAKMQALYPEAQVRVKCYGLAKGQAIDFRAVMVCSGVPELPRISVGAGVSRDCRFGLTLANDTGSLASINYGVSSIHGRDNTGQSIGDGGAVQGLWEQVGVRPPFLLSSSAPLPAEARERLSAKLEVLHSVLAIENGVLIPSQDPSHATYLYANGDGHVLNDFGSDPSGTPMYRNCSVDADGVRHGVMSGRRLRRVSGAAMPLMFTPMLHKWHSHFMLQCLPRVRIVRDLGQDVTILLPSDLRKKQFEMLELLGIGPGQVVLIEPDELIQADRLLCPWPWRLCFTQYSAAVYDEIASKVEPVVEKTPRRILISRESRKSWRNLINYESVKQMLLGEFGFVEVAPEKLTLAEEVATYRNAEIVVGAEGAGLYGAVFSTPATRYITICDEDYVMPILGSLAHVRGFDVGYLFGESFRADRDVSRRLPYGHADFAVDVDRLRQMVKQVLIR